MFGWKRKPRETARIRAARKALTESAGELVEARAARMEADRTAEDFKERAVTLREIRLANHITPSLFPAAHKGRTQP